MKRDKEKILDVALSAYIGSELSRGNIESCCVCKRKFNYYEKTYEFRHNDETYFLCLPCANYSTEVAKFTDYDKHWFSKSKLFVLEMLIKEWEYEGVDDFRTTRVCHVCLRNIGSRKIFYIFKDVQKLSALGHMIVCSTCYRIYRDTVNTQEEIQAFRLAVQATKERLNCLRKEV